jgi:ATP-binding cassette subfamily F protein uup
VLEEALARYPGAVVLVSHDRYFVDSVATTVYEIESGSLVARRAPAPALARTADRPVRKPPPRTSRGAPTPDAPSRKEVESRIEALEKERTDLEAKLAAPETFKAGDRGRGALGRFEAVRAELEAAYATWLALEPSTDR